jgi:hypothetical protein
MPYAYSCYSEGIDVVRCCKKKKKTQTGCDVESWKLLGRTNFQGILTEELPRIDLGPTEHQVVSESL